MTAPQFQLKCLGEPSITGLDGQPLRIRVRKHFGLLVYLVVERDRRHRREHLAELLWPNLPEADGKHSLATAITSLRAAFGTDVVETDRGGLRWAFGDLAVDLDRLAGGDVLGDETGDGLLDVGTFLQGFEIPGATEFMLWRERQRATWLPRISDALVLLMDRCRRTGDSRQIEQLADRMLALDDLSEEAIRAKMEARAFAGDRLSALRIFEAWKERLHDELGAEPSPQIEGIAVRLRKRGWERTSHRAIAAVRTEQWRNRPFIGRRQEYRVLYEAWERTRRGEPGHVLVAGESGVGKSTLVERLTTAAGLEGASVSRVQCYELEREIPFAAIGGLVHGLLDRPGAAATSPDALTELARAVPEVRRRYANLPAALETDGETARYRIAESLHQLVRSVADEHPLILVVDDHHLADDASLALIHILLRRVASDPVMLVLVARPSDMGASPHAVKLRDNLARFGTETVNIAPLGDDDSAELVATLLAAGERQASPAVRRALLHAGCGYPMAMELLCRDWLEHGERSLVLTLDAMTVDPSTAGAPMEAIQQLHQRVTSTMSPVARAVLDLSALLGSRLNDLGMYDILDLSVGQVLEGMTALTDNRVLRDHGASLDYSNELFRAHVYLEIPSTLRRALHGAVADKLIDAERDGESVPGLEIAWHCMRSGRAVEGTSYLLAGSRQSIDHGAPHEAELALRSALSNLSDVAAPEATLLLAESVQEQGNWRDSLTTLLRLSGESDRNVVAKREAAALIARSRLHLVAKSDRANCIQRLLAFVTDPPSPEAATHCLHAASVVLLGARDDEAAGALLRLASQIDRSQLPARIGLALAMVEFRTRYLLGERESLVNRMTMCLRNTQEVSLRGSGVVDLRIGLAAIHCALGNSQQALAGFSVAYDEARDIDNTHLMSSAAANAALCCGRLGEYSSQVAWANRALDCAPTDNGYCRLLSLYCSAMGLLLTGKREEAHSNIQTLRRFATAPNEDWLLQASHLYVADCLTLDGQHTQALKAARAATSNQFKTPLTRAFVGLYARWLAAGCHDSQLALSSLDKICWSLEEIDVIDRVQVLWAKTTLLEEMNDDRQVIERKELNRCLDQVPLPTHQLLNRMFLIAANHRLKRDSGLPA